MDRNSEHKELDMRECNSKGNQDFRCNTCGLHLTHEFKMRSSAGRLLCVGSKDGVKANGRLQTIDCAKSEAFELFPYGMCELGSSSEGDSGNNG
eukprot:2069415-Pleurochrysis_carterae.AAC.1